MKLLLAFVLSQGINGDSLHWPFKPEEKKLYSLINDYRSRYKLPSLQYSDSLSFVASTHSVDLIVAYENNGCNLHSWSKYGDWTPGCLSPTQGDISIMTHKPKEIIGMDELGFEMVHLHQNKEEPCNAACAFSYFYQMNMFRHMMREEGYPKWKKMGLNIFQGAASVWFTPAEDQ
jgi:hypothetical protein